MANIIDQIPGRVIAVGRSYCGAVNSNAASMAKYVVGLPLEEEHGCKCGESGAALQPQHHQCLARTAREPREGEKGYHRYLACHQELPEMRRGALIRLCSNAEPSDVDEYEAEGSA